MPPKSSRASRPWLLDHNLPAPLSEWLGARGVPCETSAARGWQELSNGELVRHAEDEFEVILTRDRRFVESAGVAARESDICIVYVQLPQAPAQAFLEAFEAEWNRRPILIKPGSLIGWPGPLRC